MRNLAIPVLALLGAACSVDQPVESAPPPAGGKCSTQNIGEFIGRKATAELGAEIQIRTGAEIFQWVGPDQAVTMDYRENRVRVFYDANMIVDRIACG